MVLVVMVCHSLFFYIEVLEASPLKNCNEFVALEVSKLCNSSEVLGLHLSI